jgi:hypothetical protein
VLVTAGRHYGLEVQTRAVEDDQTIRYGSVRYSTPPGFVTDSAS